jgi:hypothetical protein
MEYNCESTEMGGKEPECIRRIRKLELDFGARIAMQDQVNQQFREGLADNKQIIQVIAGISQVQTAMQENINFIKEGVSDIKTTIAMKADKCDVVDIKETMALKADKDDVEKLERITQLKVNEKDLDTAITEISGVKHDISGIKNAPIEDIRAIKVGAISGGVVVLIGVAVEIILKVLGLN